MKKRISIGKPFFILCCWLSIAAPLTHARPPAVEDPRQDALDFIQIAETRLAPVYGPLAEQIVSEFGLARLQGTGIDLGGGPGNLVIELCRRTEKMHWINADINPHFFPYFNEQAAKAGFTQRVRAVAADAQDLPFESDYAEIVVSRASFQFWGDKKKAFAEIYRVLKPGCPAFIGRGFPANLPLETARKIRAETDGGPHYDIEQTAAGLRAIMQALEIEDYRIRIPRPPGSEGVNYGIWLEFRKPSGITRTAGIQEVDQVMDTILVTGRPPRDAVARPRIESSGLEPATSVVQQAEIVRQGAKTVIEALEYIPGSWVETRGRKVKQFFSIRGQKYPYPDYALDGAWQREFHELPYFFSSEDVERIEVMRSSAALLTGLSGLVGVVNIIPRQYREPETAIRLEYGSFNTWRLNLTHGGTSGDLSYAFSLGTPRTQGPAGRHADEGITHFRSSSVWSPNERWSVTTHILHLRGHRELARAVPPASARFRDALEKFDPLRATLASVKTLYRPGGKASTEFILNYSGREHTFISETATPHQSTRERDYEWSTNLTQSLVLRPGNVLRVGALYNHWVAPNGKRFYVGRRCDLETYSAVVVDEQSFGPLTLDAGLRWTRTYINRYGAFNIGGSPKGLKKVTPVTDQWEPSLITASLGTSYDLSPGLSLHFNLSSGNIKPRRGELDVNLREPGTERRIKLDFGVQALKAGAGMVSMAVFLTEQKDAIVLSGLTETLGGRVMELYLNRDQDQLGLEIDARSAPLAGNVQLFLNLLAMRSRAEANGKMVRNGELPRFIASSGLYFSRGKLDLTLLWKYVSAYESTRFAGGSPPVPQPLGGYHNLNATAGWSFGSKPRNRVYLEARNLADKEFSTVVGYPDYGRRFTVGWRSSFK